MITLWIHASVYIHSHVSIHAAVNISTTKLRRTQSKFFIKPKMGDFLHHQEVYTCKNVWDWLWVSNKVPAHCIAYLVGTLNWVMCELSSLNVLNDTYVVPPGTFFKYFFISFFSVGLLFNFVTFVRIKSIDFLCYVLNLILSLLISRVFFLNSYNFFINL